MPRPGSKTLIYSPECRLYIGGQKEDIDVSADIIRGNIQRLVNSSSTFQFELNNKGHKYTRRIQRMDRVTIWLKSVGKWQQALAGYISSAPFLDLYPTTCTIAGQCTLKRIINTWWNPYLPESLTLLNQEAVGNLQQLTTPDAGLGVMITNLLTKVGGWDKKAIHIQAIPEDFLKFVKAHIKLEDTAQMEAVLRKALGLDGVSGGNAGSAGGINVPQTKGSFTPVQLAQMCAQAGFHGQGLVDAIGVILAESGGNPKAVNQNQDSHHTIDRGLFQINNYWHPEVTNPFDPATNIKAGFKISSGGTQWGQWSTWNGGQAQSHFATARAAIAAAKNAPPVSGSAGGQGGGGIGGIIGTIGNTGLGLGTSAPGGGSGGLKGTGIPYYGDGAGEGKILKYFGGSRSGVEKNLVNINFQGHTVQMNKTVAPAFQKVSDEWTSNKIPYKARIVYTYEWRMMVGGTGTRSYHSYGIALDLNPDTNPYVGSGAPTKHDVPNSIVSLFKSVGLHWGGDWSSPKDYMHFQYNGGPLSGSAVDSTGGGSGGSDAKDLIFNVLYKQPVLSGTAMAFTGEKAFIDEEQLITTIQSFTRAGLRSFQSAPNGDFIAWYPDYFGIHGSTPVLSLEDVEMKVMKIDINDDAMATHVYVAGDFFQEGNVSILDWMDTPGVVSIDQPAIFDELINMNSKDKKLYAPEAIYARYGARPLKASYPVIRSKIFTYFQALQLFMQKWSEQYSTTVQFTFMPILYPGMRVELIGHDLAVYVESVTHTIDYEQGFSTQAVISSPSTKKGGISGLPIGSL